MDPMRGRRFKDAFGRGAGCEVDTVPRKRGRAASLRAAAPAVLCGLAIFLGGFVIFAIHIGGMSMPQDPPEADAIIVLTGGQARIDAALSLLKSGKGDRLLISGVHPDTTRKSLQAATGGDEALFSCCVDIDRDALNTVGNAAESAKWVRSHNYDRVILVTNNYHMPRSLLEIGRLLDREELDPYPVVNTSLAKGEWMVRPEALRVLFTEYGKYLAALARGLLPVSPPETGTVTMVGASASGSAD